MRIAADLALVFAALMFLLVLGLGLPALTSRNGPFESPRQKVQALGLAMAAGLLANYAAGLLLADLRFVLLASGAIAAASVACAVMQPRFLAPLLHLGRLRWWFAIGLVLFFCGPILFEPLRAWDARSIWFFQAKRIYYDGGLDIGRSWINPAYGFSHVDYPKLLPMLAAQFAYAAGFWNEYIPKAGLLALLVPAVLGLLGAARNLGACFVFLAIAFLLGGGDMMWNGYADAYFALYAGIALLFWSRWLRGGAVLDLVSAIAYLGVAVNLKNEGTLFALCVCAGLLCFAPRAIEILHGKPVPAAVWLALLLPLAGYLTWTFTKMYWNAPNDLALGLGSIARALQRLGDGSALLIVQAFASQSRLVAGVAAFLLAAVVGRGLGVMPATAWFPAGVATLYMAGMFLIYLSTPHGLTWHLATSVDRTLLTVAFGFFGSAFLALEAVGPAWRGSAAARATNASLQPGIPK